MPSNAADAESEAEPAAGTALRVTKKLAPSQPGAIKLARRFGERLLCVRYRRDEGRQLRYTTVELIVECVPLQGSAARRRLPQPDVYVRIEYFERRLRALARDHGAAWDPETSLWRMPYRVALCLNLRNRIVKKAAITARQHQPETASSRRR